MLTTYKNRIFQLARQVGDLDVIGKLEILL